MNKFITFLKNILKSKAKNMEIQNIQIISDINEFQIDIMNFGPVSGQFTNPRVNWFYLLNQNNEQIRCFTNSEAIDVMNFISIVLRNSTQCFININLSNCINDECEHEVAVGVRQQRPYRTKIFHTDFGKNGITQYTLNFDIIGYLY